MTQETDLDNYAYESTLPFLILTLRLGLGLRQITEQGRQPSRLRGPHPDPARFPGAYTISDTRSIPNLRRFSTELLVMTKKKFFTII